MNLPSRLIVCLLLALPVTAQEPVTPPAAEARIGRPVPVIVDLSFPGGTVAELVARIRQKEPRANIVVADQAATAVLPAIDLRGTGLDQALAGACAVAGGDQQIRVKDVRGVGETVYTITAHRVQGPESVGPKDGPGTEVYSLRRLTAAPRDAGGASAATVLSAVETAVGGEGRRLANLLYHEDSGLMIARGSREQLAIVHDVLRSLEQNLTPARPRPAQDGSKTPDTGK
jgi:CheY-like chemotaxis protein